MKYMRNTWTFYETYMSKYIWNTWEIHGHFTSVQDFIAVRIAAFVCSLNACTVCSLNIYIITNKEKGGRERWYHIKYNIILYLIILDAIIYLIILDAIIFTSLSCALFLANHHLKYNIIFIYSRRYNIYFNFLSFNFLSFNFLSSSLCC